MAADWRDRVPAARAQARESGAAVYIVATLQGHAVTATQPPAARRHFRVSPDGAVDINDGLHEPHYQAARV